MEALTLPSHADLAWVAAPLLAEVVGGLEKASLASTRLSTPQVAPTTPRQVATLRQVEAVLAAVSKPACKLRCLDLGGRYFKLK